MIVAIVGAGPLATALASTLAARGRVRHIRLIDDAGTVAAGKALDVRQATPVLGTDVSIDATTDIAAAIDADAVVIADAHGAPAVEWEGELGLALVGRLAAANRRAPIVCAGARQASLVERGVTEVRLPWTRILGSASIAFDAAARAVVADAAGTAPRAVALGLAGLPPSRLVVAWSASSIEGVPAETRLGPGVLASATRRLTAAWPPGPFALATAAAVLLEHLDGAAAAALPAIVATPAQGHRAGIALVRVGPSGVLHAAEPALSPYERIALDNAIAFRR
jgi:lactate/malate dehydrogenase, NAD binding domain